MNEESHASGDMYYYFPIIARDKLYWLNVLLKLLRLYSLSFRIDVDECRWMFQD